MYSPSRLSNHSYQLEQHALDLMHRLRDDVAGVSSLFLAPTRRPISRPSSRASSHSMRLNAARADTPASLPNSPLPIGFRRSRTPVASPFVGGNASSYITAWSVSPMHSPVLAHTQSIQTQAQFTASLPPSPISSPRLLSAKATEFKPIQRPLSAASSNLATLSGYRAETPSPDLWSHRASSSLVIAAPLFNPLSLEPLRPVHSDHLLNLVGMKTKKIHLTPLRPRPGLPPFISSW